MSTLAYLNNVALPEHFRYTPYIPSKRVTITKTVGAVITQREGPTPIVHGDGEISWSCNACNVDEFMLIYEMYLEEGLVEFSGYWGEAYLVRFLKMEEPKRVYNRRFDLAGSFQVVCVVRDYLPRC